jgi:hypothetical protein
MGMTAMSDAVHVFWACWAYVGPLIDFFTQPIPSAIALWLALVAPMWIAMWLLFRWDRRKDAELQRRWRQQDAARQRRWDLERQVSDMERQIWDEQLSDEEREWKREAQAQSAEVRREAHRRLG